MSAAVLESVFYTCFFENDNTLLKGGFDEPVYSPSCTQGKAHSLGYREDFFSSALHEAAHWCIAGRQRRLKLDFGYWYTPDGRSQSQQRAFENVEFQPQALEWFFSKACKHRFRISVDNLDSSHCFVPDEMHFDQRVLDQANYWCENGLPDRAAVFFRALCKVYNTDDNLDSLQFSLAEL